MTVVSNDEIYSSGVRVWVIRCGACDTLLRTSSARILQIHAACTAHAAALDPAHAPVPAVATWIREHGDANKMTVVSNDEFNGSGGRVWAIRCSACGTTLRITGPKKLHRHAACAAHTVAVNTARAPESKVATWIREHGDANTMTVVSNNEVNGGGGRVWVMRCGACSTTLRVKSHNDLQKHAACAAHTAALNPARARESKVAAWIREHGDANKMTIVSNEEINGSGNRVWVIRCGACEKNLRVVGPYALQLHIDTAAHASAFSQPRSAPRKRSRS
jgi:DNA recombination-dependent growth factor C